MKLAAKIFGTFFLASVLIGCSSDIEIRGEVFVEKDGKPSFLSNAEVALLPEIDFKRHIKARYTEVPGVVEVTKAEISKKQEMKNQLEDSTAKLGKLKESLALAKQAELGALPDQYKLAVLRSIEGMPGVASAIAEEHIKYLSAQKNTLNKQKRQLHGLLAAEIVRRAIKEKITNDGSPEIDEKKFAEMISDAEKIYGGKISDSEIIRFAVKYINGKDSGVLRDVDKSLEENEGLNKELVDSVKRLEGKMAGIVSGGDGEFYYPDLAKDSSIASLHTGSDGVFTFVLKKGERMALIASKDNLYWFLWIQSKEDIKLNLTEKNSLGTECRDCIFNENEAPGNF